ncbi:MAG TPA: alpha-L-fucosidase [Phycisphaerae bacterium]|nr:alpha-L-fucosidase [Phycisphaerae bacterium]
MRATVTRIIHAVLIGAFSASGVLAADSPATQPTQDYLRATPADLRWFHDARFGMFVCWGPVSLTGQEIGWSRGGERRGQGNGRGPTPVEIYDNLYKQWKPDGFDARQWVKVALDGGMKYMIFLVKHHDGFCLYDTRLTDYKSTGPQSAWKIDVLKQVADACHEAGLRLFIYYSQPDWHHPDYRTENHQRYIEYLHGQIRELLTGYGRIDGLWFDGLQPRGEDRHDEKYAGADLWDADNLFRMARTIQPHLLINNRCGLPADFDTPEQKIGRFQTDRLWESCITLGTQWSWKPEDRIKPLKECIDILVRCAGGDGNLALNTGPMPDGRIEPRQADRYREIGQWLSKYGRSIYRTRGGPFPPGSWGASTHRDGKVYVHILNWETDRITLPAQVGKVVASEVLTGGSAGVKQTAQGIEISVPPADRSDLDTIVVLQLDGPAAMAAP